MNFFAHHQPVPTTSRHASEVATQIFRQNVDKTHVLDNIYNKSNDELWIETWLQQNNIYRPLPNLKKINVPPNAMTIHEAKTQLNKCVSLMGSLNKIQQDLQRNVATMSSTEWKQKTVDIGMIKDEFTRIMCKFDNAEVLKHLKVCIKNRKKKRINDRKRRDRKILEKQEDMEKRKKLHKEIDHWLNSKKEEVEKVKMEEAMQKDADMVLSEVTKKKYDARKQLSLISALIKLRLVRENVANHRGEKTSPEDKRAFNITTEKLVKMWENSLQVYLKEEQGLKLMLEKTQTEDSKQARLNKERRLVEEWKTVLFGQVHVVPTNNSTYWALTAAERELETFIAIRKSWDTFLVSPNNENGSKIPIGWILPDVNSSEAWTRYLDNSNALLG
ncbi:programmed cell death protein 7 [Euwallacea fornicatus]|uniref:programmed cell death protein 7 n=1 Tax=Euwallacea fornicatus TaxID=995702 RepID=UPI00338F131D